MSDLAGEVEDAGGPGNAPPTATARIRDLVLEALRQGRSELAAKRSGYDSPVMVAGAATGDGLVAVAPVDVALRADPDAVPERGWLLTAALVGALVELSGAPPPARARDLALRAGDMQGYLTLHMPATGADIELITLAFEEHVARVDRLRAQAIAVPAAAIGTADLRDPIGAAHPLRVAEAIARLGGRPADPASLDEHEDVVAALLEDGGGHSRPHEDPDPARRVARRILQRLHGMGKWGGYHTEFAHLPRGFAGNERGLATDVGEALLASGLLAEKPSVGQRHVFLNPRRAGDIHRLIEAGEVPAGLRLP